VAQDVAREQEAQAIGGMRHAHRSVSRLPSLLPVGRQLRRLFVAALSEFPKLREQCLGAIGHQNPRVPDEKVVAIVRGRLGALLNVDDLEPIRTEGICTEIRAHLLEGWRSMAGDPDWAVTRWLVRDGVPAGLRRHPEDCGIFPRTDVAVAADLHEMDFEDQGVYKSVQNDPDVWSEIQRLVSKNWIKQFDSEAELADFLGEHPVYSKFGMVTKIKANGIKKRLILDAKVSGVSGAASKLERIILPRLLDVAHNVLHLQAEGRTVELFILDFADAFWLLPLAPCERKWFTARLRGKHFVYLRNAQGSRNAPIGWGRVAALVGRMTQSMFDAKEVRVEIYTDDPCIAVAGTQDERDTSVAIIVLAWLCFGLPLSWHKGARGTLVDWIGGTFNVIDSPPGITVRIKESLFSEAESLVRDAIGQNVISHKALRSLVGKLSNIANLLITWRPFLSPLFAALYSAPPNGAPMNCIWTKQIKSELEWFAAFFKASGGFIERIFDLSCFLRADTVVDIVMDASPWGLGAILCLNEQPIEYFSDQITAMDTARFDTSIGDAAGQQTWECLAALVAIRHWRRRWQVHRVKLMVRGDSVAMLTLVLNMRPHTKAMRIIAQELAIDTAHYSFVPMVTHHIPGIANTIADELSRWPQPGHVQQVPKFLKNSVQVVPASRDDSYYMSLTGPHVPIQAG